MSKFKEENLQPKLIMEFTPEDTIYISIKSKDNKNEVIYLCKFVEYRSGVSGEIINSTVNPDLHKHETGKIISAPLNRCGLYGKNPVDGRTYLHWFKSSGYAIYPTDYLKHKTDSDIINSHPSFGMAGFSRVSGRGMTLFGSSIQHNEIMTLRIQTAEVDRHLSREWYHAKKCLIEVDFSSTQFAEMITSPNQGSGVPCTIRYLDGVRIPEPPYESVKDRYSSEFKAKMGNITERVDDSLNIVKNILSKDRITKGDKEEILALCVEYFNSIKSGVPFIEKSFTEQMERTVLEAKNEVEAFVQRRLTEEGIKALTGGSGEFKLLENSSDNE